jgi:capsid assembly protease
MTARLIERLAGMPWLIHEPALRTIVELAQREPPEPDNLAAWKALMAPSVEALEMRTAAPLPGARRAMLRDGVAILSVQGPIFRHASLMTEISGATALGDLSKDLTLALDDSRVTAILLDVNSPGGEVTGIAEAADAIRAAGASKRIVAHVDGAAASAAYWLAAAAQEIVVSTTASLGSLGAVISLMDTRQRDAAQGMRRHEFVSSQTPGKRPDPASDSGQAAYQRIVDGLAAEFLSAIASFRGVSVDALLAATHGGGLILGREAVAAGMADRLGSFEETLASLAVRSPRASIITAHTAKEPLMSEENPAPATPEAEAAAPPAAPPVAAPVPEASAPDALAVERARTAGIMAAMQPGFQQLATLAMEQGWTLETFNAAQTAALAGRNATQRADAAAQHAGSFPAPVAGAGEVPNPSTLPPEERARAEFEADASVRAEFGTVERYAAYLKAQQRGSVRLISKRG